MICQITGKDNLKIAHSYVPANGYLIRIAIIAVFLYENFLY